MKFQLLAPLLFLSFFVSGQSNLTFSKQQMLDDFDTLVATIYRVSPHLPVKKDLWRYDVQKQMKKLRLRIDTVRSDLSYFIVLQSVINAVQDLHTSFVQQDDEWAKKQYNDYRKARNAFKLSFGNVYANGKYCITSPFLIQSDTIKTGAEITHIEGQKVDRYLQERLSSTHGITYDLNNRKYYYPGFFRNAETIFKDSLVVTFKSGKTSKTYLLPTRQFTQYLPSARYQDTSRVELWADQKIIYIRMTDMDPELTPAIKVELAEIFGQKSPVEKIIIDIRDNPGGQDNAWINLFSDLIPKPISYPLVIDDLANSVMTKEKIESFGVKAAKIERDPNPLLKKYNFYTIVNTTETLEPSADGFQFPGKIFLLAENHYSSAGSAVAVASADPNDNLISVGRKTGYFLGIGFSPQVFTLPNTKLKYRIAPSIDVSNVKKMEDLMHDRLEVEIPFDMNYYQHKFDWKGQPTDKEFLLQHDPFIKAVLER